MTKDQVIELARGIHLIDSRGACSFVEGTNIVPYLEKFATLVRNSALEEAAQKCDYTGPQGNPLALINQAFAQEIRNLKDKS